MPIVYELTPALSPSVPKGPQDGSENANFCSLSKFSQFSQFFFNCIMTTRCSFQKSCSVFPDPAACLRGPRNVFPWVLATRFWEYQLVFPRNRRRNVPENDWRPFLTVDSGPRRGPREIGPISGWGKLMFSDNFSRLFIFRFSDARASFRLHTFRGWFFWKAPL